MIFISFMCILMFYNTILLHIFVDIGYNNTPTDLILIHHINANYGKIQEFSFTEEKYYLGDVNIFSNRFLKRI